MKKYKNCPPENTISRIKNILYGIGIEIKEESIQSYFSSCRLKIVNDGLELIDIGTNGKGRDYEYSLASGYGELMERLQNRFLWDDYRYDFLGEKLKYVYDPKEEFWDTEELIENSGDILRDCFHLIDERLSIKKFLNRSGLGSSHLMLPFYSVFDDKQRYLPYELLLYAIGSNGMASGNTDEEAISQAICEIFERYVMRRIYTDVRGLPTIPESYYSNTEIFRKICSIKKEKNYSVIVKDCSLGLDLPVVGVLIIDKSSGCYNFNLGADCNPIVAIERCMTELYQNQYDFFRKDIRFAGINNDLYANYQKCLVNTYGYWPKSIFIEKGKFNFDNLFYKQQIENDLEYCVTIIKKLGHSIYIRNNSFLGFPSFHVIIPGMSECIMQSEDILKDGRNGKLINLLHKFDELNDDEYKQFVQMFEKEYPNIIAYGDEFKSYLYANDNLDINDLDWNLFAFMLFYKNGNYGKSLKYLELFLKDKDKTNYIYYDAVRLFVTLNKVGKSSLKETSDILSKCFGTELAEEIVNDIDDRKKIFKYYKMPSCPNCNKCKLKNNCKLDTIIELEIRLNEKTESAAIDQSSISKLFDFLCR